MFVSRIGKRREGEFLKIPDAILKESVPNSTYEVRIVTKTIPPQEHDALINNILTLTRRYKGVRLVYVDVTNIEGRAGGTPSHSVVRIQLTGSPIIWAVLLPILIGIIPYVILFLGIYLLVSAVPSWVWALIAVGFAFMVASPVIVEITKKRPEGK